MKRLILVILAIVVSACATPEPRVDNNAGAYNNRGVAYYFKGEYKKAWAAKLTQSFLTLSAKLQGDKNELERSIYTSGRPRVRDRST